MPPYGFELSVAMVRSPLIEDCVMYLDMYVA